MAFDDCYVPKERMIGEKEGGGLGQLEGTLKSGRLTYGARSTGVGQAAFDATLSFVKGNRRDGQPLTKSQAIRFIMAEMAMSLEAMRYMTYRGAWLFDQGLASMKDASIVKFFCSESVQTIVQKAMAIQKNAGLMMDNPVQRFLRDGRLSKIPEGTSEIQHLVIFSSKEVRVPLANRVGRQGEGMAHVNHYHQAMGLRSAAQALGTAQGAFDRAIQHAKQREQFGRKLSQFQVIRHKLADMATGIEVSRCLIYKGAGEYDKGRADLGFLSMAQLDVGRRMTSIVDEAVQIFGGYGYMAEQAIEHYFRDAWAIAVELGTQEELKDVIADGLLGPLNKK